MKRIIKEEYYELRKKIHFQEAECSDLPYFHAGKRAHVSFIRVLFTALIAVCVMVVCLGIGSFRGVIAGAPDVNDVDISPLGYATFLYDDQGTQIRQLSAPTSNRLPVSLDQIPVSLQHAVVAIEDERFYEHNGIDVRGIARAE